MIQISTLSSNIFDKNFLQKSEAALLSLELMQDDVVTEERNFISILNKATSCLPELNESPSDACIDAILAFSRRTKRLEN